MASMQEFGRLIKETRTQRGLSGMELARRIGRPHSFIVRIERGRNVYPPDPYDFKRISQELGLSRERMLQALGYLDREPAEVVDDGAVLRISVDDPRVDLLRVLDSASGPQVRSIIRVIDTVLEEFGEPAGEKETAPGTTP